LGASAQFSIQGKKPPSKKDPGLCRPSHMDLHYVAEHYAWAQNVCYMLLKKQYPVKQKLYPGPSIIIGL
jgi:hypothetical protein